MKVDKELVSGLSGKIANSNNNINTAFENVVAAINTLGNAWSGAAYGHASASFGSIRSKFYGARYNSVNNCVNFLDNQIVRGYSDTETANVSLADQFK